MIPVLVDGLRCDRTRVVTLTLPRPSNTEIGIGPGDLDQDYSDLTRGTGPVADRAREGIASYHVYVARQVARLGEALGASDARLLDDTIIAWMSQEGQPGHRTFPWHVVFAGGRAMGVTPGRYLRMEQEVPVQVLGRTHLAGPAHNQALVTLARQFGLDVDAVGAREIRVPGGALVSATGGIPGM